MSLLALVGFSDSAYACTKPLPIQWTLDPQLAGAELEPPAPPVLVAAVVTRSKGTACKPDGLCVISDCGDSAGVRLEIIPAQSVDSEPQRLGYQLRWSDGLVPPELIDTLGEVRTGSSALYWTLPFDKVVALNATFELVALDRAGNESEASTPFELLFDGCTKQPLSNDCLESLLAPGTVIEANSAVLLEPEQTTSCAVSSRVSTRTEKRTLWLSSVSVLGCLWLLRRRKHRRRRRLTNVGIRPIRPKAPYQRSGTVTSP